VFLHGNLMINMKVITSMMQSMDKGNLYGLMDHQLKVNLSMERCIYFYLNYRNGIVIYKK